MNAQYIIAARSDIGDLWPLLEIFENKTDKPMKVVNAYLEPILKEAIEKQKMLLQDKKTEEGEENQTLLDHLVRDTSGMCSQYENRVSSYNF